MCYSVKAKAEDGKVKLTGLDGVTETGHTYDITTKEGRDEAARKLNEIAQSTNPMVYLTDPQSHRRVRRVINNEAAHCLDCELDDGEITKLVDLAVGSPEERREARRERITPRNDDRRVGYVQDDGE